MDAARRILLLDFGIALSWIAVGATTASTAAVVDRWWVAALGFALAVGAWYVSDRTTAERWGGWAGMAVAGLVLLAVPFGVAALLLAGGPPVDIVAAGMAGLGLGGCCYRVIYGLLRPIPERRLEQSRGQRV